MGKNDSFEQYIYYANVSSPINLFVSFDILTPHHSTDECKIIRWFSILSQYLINNNMTPQQVVRKHCFAYDIF